jgi:integrase/recombinase XerD
MQGEHWSTTSKWMHRDESSFRQTRHRNHIAEDDTVIIAEDAQASISRRDKVLSDAQVEIAGLAVGDLHQNRGYDSLRVEREGGRREALAISPANGVAAASISGEGRSRGRHRRAIVPPSSQQSQQAGSTALHGPDAIDRVVRKHALAIGIERGYSAHSMRATFITANLENGAQLEDVQKAADHRDQSTTKP